MLSDMFWNVFEQSGSLEAYLACKECQEKTNYLQENMPYKGKNKQDHDIIQEISNF